MPVVKTAKLTLTDGPFTLKVCCDSSGKFSAYLPHGAAQALGFNKVEGATLDKCVDAFHKAMATYRERKTTTRKVIFSEVKDNISFADGISMSVQAVVLQEFATISPGRNTYRYEVMKSTLPAPLQRGWRLGHTRNEPLVSLMDWTPEREEFFARLGRGLLAVQDELDKLRKPDVATQIADSGSLTLGAPKDKKTTKTKGTR